MKKNPKLPTLLGLIILVIGIVSGIMLINSKQIFKLKANTEAAPKNVRITNIVDNSATVTWTTDIESQGFVKWGENELAINKVSLEDGDKKSLIHSVTIISNNKTGQNILFKINSNGKDYDNNNKLWSFSLLQNKINNQDSLIASGTILNPDGSTPALAIVYLTINGVIVSSITSENGNYVIPISNYVDKIIDTQAIEISVQGGTKGVSSAVIYPKTIKSVPAMVLGRTYDFRSAEDINSNQQPESNLTIPEQVNASSRFEITKSENNSQETKTVVVESIDEGEIITTTDPEFFGEGPANAEIQIQIESELQTGTITTKSNGDWSWSPPNNLEAGEHKLTLKWKDANGILRTLTRTFVVSAAEGPAFESTPSATPENSAAITPTASSKSSTTPSSSSTPSATLMPTPETGSLTPTIGLFIMGIGLLFGSIYLVKQHA